MRKFIILIVIAATALWLSSRPMALEPTPNTSHEIIEPPAASSPASPQINSQPQTITTAPPSPPDSSTTLSPATEVAAPSQPKEPPTPPHWSSLVKLDLPQPKSVADLMKHLNAFENPRVPNDPEVFDGSVATTYRGYYEASAGEFLKVEINRAFSMPEGDAIVTLETRGGKTATFAVGASGLANFNKDRYSLVIKFPNGLLAYLKFSIDVKVPGYENTTRSYAGWLINKEKPPKTIRVALIDGLHYDLDPTNRQDYEWPKLESIRAIFPNTLPATNP